MPAASAMSRTVVFLKPFSAKRPAAIASSWSRRVAEACVSSGMLAAHGDDLTGHVGGVVAGEEHHDVGDLPWLGGPFERLTVGELGQQLVGGDLREERVHGEARRDRVDPDAVRCEV